MVTVTIALPPKPAVALDQLHGHIEGKTIA